jgi:hypothetical protein
LQLDVSFLWSLEHASYALVFSRKIPTTFTSPNQDIPTIGTVVLYAFVIRHNRSTA